MISNDLKWNVHVEMIIMSKSRNTSLVSLAIKCAKVPTKDLLEYACPVFHTALLRYLSDQLERLQKRALRIVRSHDFCYT